MGRREVDVDYLKARFHNELGDEANLYVERGQVCIRGRNWDPEVVLQSMSANTYEEVFKEWLEDRKQDLLGKATLIVERFEQVDRFAALKATYQRGAVIPFIGAGLSQPSGYPGWSKFLFRLRQQTIIPEGEFVSQLARGEFEEAAQALSDALGAGFNEEVENAFGVDRELFGPVQLMPYVFSSAVITTNFDSVLKRCYDNAAESFSETIPGHEAQELPRFLGANQRVLVKIHGRALSGIGRVLTGSEYNAMYGDGKLMPLIVQTICSRALLFMGCSLTVDRLLAEIQRFVETNGHDRVPRHYAFLPAPESEEDRLARKGTLSQHNIYPIWYPAEEHDDSIEALLYRLADGVVDL
jgi:hypothetical protein